MAMGRSNPDASYKSYFRHLYGSFAVADDALLTAIAAQFERKNAGNLFSGRGGKLTDSCKRVKSAGDFELITWLVIK